MVIKVENFGEDELKKLYSDLYDKEDWFEECALCRMPTMLHRDIDGKRIGSCTRKTSTSEEYGNSWSLFKRKMKSVISWYRDDMDKKRANNEFMEVMKTNQEMMKNLVETMMNSRGTTNKLIKPAKVPSWCKGMKIESYKKSLEDDGK